VRPLASRVSHCLRTQVHAVAVFLRKATSPEIQLYPRAVEQWVTQHQFDVSREERWRTTMKQQIGRVDEGVGGIEQRLTRMEAMVQQLVDSQTQQQTHRSSPGGGLSAGFFDAAGAIFPFKKRNDPVRRVGEGGGGSGGSSSPLGELRA